MGETTLHSRQQSGGGLLAIAAAAFPAADLFLHTPGSPAPYTCLAQARLLR